MKQLTLLALALGSLVAACNSQKNTQFRLNESFMLRIGHTAEWQEDPRIQIRFASVTEDSRCPQNIQCVWAGRAIMAITLIENDKTKSSALIMGEPAGTGYSKFAQLGDLTVELMQILPHPTASLKIDPERYVMELEIRKEE